MKLKFALLDQSQSSFVYEYIKGAHTYLLIIPQLPPGIPAVVVRGRNAGIELDGLRVVNNGLAVFKSKDRTHLYVYIRMV